MINIENPWVVLPLALLGLGILICGIWKFFISSILPKKISGKVTQVYLAQGVYTLNGTATKYHTGILVKGTMHVTSNDPREPWDIQFWLPVDMPIEKVSLCYHSSHLYKGFALLDDTGRKMYLPGAKDVVVIAL